MKWCLNPFRKIRKLKDELKKLEKKLNKMAVDHENCNIEHKNEIERLNKQLADEIEKSARDISKRDEEIEKLNRELDVLYRYYDLDKEASEYTKRQIRIDKTVFELRMENMQLKKQVNDGIFRMLSELKQNRDKLASSFWNPYSGMMQYRW